ncbi:MAG: HAMP domain-containing sensor histidine kinase [Anaerolineae bacterium]|jgi:signal transduction histidine kinase
MSSDDQAAGIALLCDPHGLLLEVLHDGLGLTEEVQAGRPFTQVIEPTGLGKALSFLAELRARGAAFDWELNVPFAETISTLYFTGVVTDDKLLIVAASTRSAVPRLCEELMHINQEQGNALRQVFKERNDLVRAQSEQSSVLYDELSRLNNELVNLQRELAKRNAELERLNELKNQFLGTAAHDLRNPLAIIWSYSDSLLYRISDLLSEEHLEFLSIIQSSSEFMLHMVDDLLDVSAIESGRLNLDLQPTDLSALVEHNVMLNRVLAEKKQIRLSFQAAGDLPTLLLDPAKIEQVLNNLVSNAVKFSYPGSSVAIRVYRNKDRALISVKDQGQGVPADEVDKLFKWFGKTSTKGTEGESSAGLGLAIAQRIVLGHQGTIWVESEAGKGSTFYVSLPTQPDWAFDR